MKEVKVLLGSFLLIAVLLGYQIYKNRSTENKPSPLPGDPGSDLTANQSTASPTASPQITFNPSTTKVVTTDMSIPLSATPSANINLNDLNIIISKQGEGEGAKDGDTLTVHYVGSLADGTKFDSSLDRQQPITITLGAGQVIKGWDEGLKGMKVNEVRKLVIPPHLGYGSQGAGNGAIPPNSVLVFEIQLLKIN